MDNQFRFMSDRSPTEAIFLVTKFDENLITEENISSPDIQSLKKTYDRVTRKNLNKVLEKKEIHIKYINFIKDTHK